MSNEIYTPEEAAELLRLHPGTVRRFIREGKLRAVKLPGYRISAADLQAFWHDQGGGQLFRVAQEAKPSKLLSPSADGLVVLASAPQIGRLEVTVSFPRGIVRRWRPRTRHEVIAYRAMCALTELFPHTDLWESKVRVFLVEGETVASVTTAFGSVFSVYGFPEGVPA